MMAREIAVDVASHSPQVDPILDELTDALADLRPMSPEIPYYSATMYDPRDEPLCDAGYWVDNLRQMVRFAPAVQRPWRMATGSSPSCRPTRCSRMRSSRPPAVSTCRWPLWPVCAANKRCHTGCAALWRICTARAPRWTSPCCTRMGSWWTRRCRPGLTVGCLLSRGGQESPTHGGCTVSVHPLLGAHVRLQEEPERHVWQAEVGTAAQPWLGDHRIRNVAVLPGAAYCEMALAAARAVLGEASEVRDIRFEQALLLDEQTTVGASAALSSPGVADFTVETNQGGEHARQAAAVLHAADEEQPPAHDISALLAAHPRRENGTEVRKRLDLRGVQYGPAFAGLAAVHTGDGTSDTVLVEVALPRQIRSQQDAYGIHPALLDACFQSVAADPAVQALGENALALPIWVFVDSAPTVRPAARYCYTRVTKAETSGVEADLDVLDEHGAVLLAVTGCDWAPEHPRTATTIACWPTGC